MREHSVEQLDWFGFFGEQAEFDQEGPVEQHEWCGANSLFALLDLERVWLTRGACVFWFMVVGILSLVG